ncbi:hypothetical protein RRG08_045905 [Elysia crispata]|uniref:Uncharacterized protein n=1 Tax=Elysia crispata TaxID=231223 RepID=A0AAE1E300_9GAST|nr:hypothetical protein RRG08_045905 [Elysia crispata]
MQFVQQLPHRVVTVSKQRNSSSFLILNRSPDDLDDAHAQTRVSRKVNKASYPGRLVDMPLRCPSWTGRRSCRAETDLMDVKPERNN